MQLKRTSNQSRSTLVFLPKSPENGVPHPRQALGLVASRPALDEHSNNVIEMLPVPLIGQVHREEEFLTVELDLDGLALGLDRPVLGDPYKGRLTSCHSHDKSFPCTAEWQGTKPSSFERVCQTLTVFSA